MWKFNHQEGDIVEPPVFGKEKKATFIRNQHGSLQERDNSRINQRELLEETTKEKNQGNSESKVVFSNLIKKTIDN